MISAPLDLISAHPWRRAAFTTYALSLSFFEAVILDALVRGGGREDTLLPASTFTLATTLAHV